MTIDEAIEELEQAKPYITDWKSVHCRNALQLGIEALKRVAKMRTYKPDPPGLLLPGETEE